MRLCTLLLLILGGLVGITAETPRSPVLVELFTSEGCSSCPPADALLMQLDKTQPIAGAEVIILSEHVDYWNRLGWKDPFSSADFSKRQEGYAFTLRTDGPYTPQMVVDGRTEFVGNQPRLAHDAIARAAHTPKAVVSLNASPTAEGARLQVRVEGLQGAKADVMLAITEGGLQSNVTKGENAGRNMAHSGVVRRLSVIGTATKPGFTADQIGVVIDPSWKRENLRLVVFVQEQTSKKVLGVTSIKP